MVLSRHKPDARQCALLYLGLVQEREARRAKDAERKLMTRARLAESTLKRLWSRERLDEKFLSEVQDWLLGAGWALFNAGSIFGAVKLEAVENWPSLAAKNLQSELDKVAAGKLDVFEEIELKLVETAETEPQSDNEDD
jgi:hypothetical protein